MRSASHCLSASIIYFCVRRLLIRFGVGRERMSDLDVSFPSISNDSMWFVCEMFGAYNGQLRRLFRGLKTRVKQCQEGYQGRVGRCYCSGGGV